MSIKPKLKAVDDTCSGIDLSELQRLVPAASPAAEPAPPAAISMAAKEQLDQARQRLQLWIDHSRSKDDALTRLTNLETVRAAAVRDVQGLETALGRYMTEWAVSGATELPAPWPRSPELDVARKHLQECQIAATGAEHARPALQKAFEEAQRAVPHHQNVLRIAALTALAEHSGPLLDEVEELAARQYAVRKRVLALLEVVQSGSDPTTRQQVQLISDRLQAISRAYSRFPEVEIKTCEGEWTARLNQLITGEPAATITE